MITISADGKARYNPTSMSFFDADISGWSLNDVVFVASDQFSSKANSIPMSIQVVGIEFVVDARRIPGYQKMRLLFSLELDYQKDCYRHNRRNPRE